MALSNPSASVSTPADLVNNALRRIGYKKNIGNLYDGSVAANTVLDVYAQTRDQILSANDWYFSERNVNATLLKQASSTGYFPPNLWDPTTNPPIPWLYEYAYVPDSLKIRSVRGQPLFVFDFDPQPNIFLVENDASFSPSQRVILSNVPNAIVVYTARITDLTAWNEDAIEAFAAALGRRIAPVLVGLDAAKLSAADEAKEAQEADVGRPR